MKAGDIIRLKVVTSAALYNSEADIADNNPNDLDTNVHIGTIIEIVKQLLDYWLLWMPTLKSFAYIDDIEKFNNSNCEKLS